MLKNGALLTAVCILLFLTFNCTFPLKRLTSTPTKIKYKNQTVKCRGALDPEIFIDKTISMPDDLDDFIIKIKNDAQNEKNTFMGLSNKNFLNEEDLRHYEQLVIMKKYPFLDIKELEMKYSPTSQKDTRQSVKLLSRVNIVPEPSICEPVEDAINVEIFNRGLSGFAIPTQVIKHMGTVDNKLKGDLETKKPNSDKSNIIINKPTDEMILRKLKNDISMFIDKRKIE